MADASLPERTKTCARCGELKPLSEFYPVPKEKDGFHYWCKACCAVRKREYREQSRQQKQCSQCGAVKFLEEFAKQKRNRDGHRNWCAECYRPYAAQKEAARREMADRPLCACGCGEQVKYPGATYRAGHRIRAERITLLKTYHAPLKVETDGTDQPKKYERRINRTHKQCTACGEIKPIAEFDQYPFISKLGNQGKACFSRCKPCARENVRAHRRSLTPEQKAERAEYHRLYQRLRLYGLSVSRFLELKASQDHKCAVCKRAERLSVDHCHISGKVRGLLCGHCNTALGLLKEDESIILSLLAYVRGHAREVG
jgi:hypothetical protein